MPIPTTTFDKLNAILTDAITVEQLARQVLAANGLGLLNEGLWAKQAIIDHVSRISVIAAALPAPVP